MEIELGCIADSNPADSAKTTDQAFNNLKTFASICGLLPLIQCVPSDCTAQSAAFSNCPFKPQRHAAKTPACIGTIWPPSTRRLSSFRNLRLGKQLAPSRRVNDAGVDSFRVSARHRGPRAPHARGCIGDRSELHEPNPIAIIGRSFSGNLTRQPDLASRARIFARFGSQPPPIKRGTGRIREATKAEVVNEDASSQTEPVQQKASKRNPESKRPPILAA